MADSSEYTTIPYLHINNQQEYFYMFTQNNIISIGLLKYGMETIVIPLIKRFSDCIRENQKNLVSTFHRHFSQ